MKYKIVSTDFDDTLLRDDNSISEFTKTIVQKYIKNGGTFLINTGRMIASIAKRAKEFGFSGKVVGYQGAMIYDLDKDEIIYHKPINCESAVKLLKRIETMGFNINMYIDDKLHYNHSSDYTRTYERISDIVGVEVGDDLSGYVLKNKVNVTKILVYTDPAIVKRLIKEINEELKGLFYCCYSKPFFFEAMAPGVNKGTACKYVADSMKIDMQDVIALGDSLNDVPMLEMAGLSFAVANAQSLAKGAADFICESNNDDGVAKVIEKYCLSDI